MLVQFQHPWCLQLGEDSSHRSFGDTYPCYSTLLLATDGFTWVCYVENLIYPSLEHRASISCKISETLALKL